MNKTKTVKPAPAPALGYINIRISKKAHHSLLERAIKERRTLIATLDLLLNL